MWNNSGVLNPSKTIATTLPTLAKGFKLHFTAPSILCFGTRPCCEHMSFWHPCVDWPNVICLATSYWKHLQGKSLKVSNIQLRLFYNAMYLPSTNTAGYIYGQICPFSIFCLTLHLWRLFHHVMSLQAISFGDTFRMSRKCRTGRGGWVKLKGAKQHCRVCGQLKETLVGT